MREAWIAIGVLVLGVVVPSGCAHGANAVQSTAVDPRLRAKQIELAARDRREDARRSAAIARVASASARDVTGPDATVERFVVRLANRGNTRIARIAGGVTVYDARSGRRLGLSTFAAAADVAPGETRSLAVAIPMSAFAEGAGPLARLAGAPKRVDVDLTEIGFASGARAGERE
ncbi:hypothetical protein WPS_14850 [Vulcanimicrobium alpinum]|uniref:Uncharacterized protein n=1 Tax=Vulcanimicrobium alpinum TaxID=3016050 RepID=A0AAN2C9E4_UNVUL|nr:hypothetical protein [Vulcanimicrobium alpinum]BDE06209.1 hypothetical protein WPS_14850 [Vulcanimicrobium alpinum]